TWRRRPAASTFPLPRSARATSARAACCANPWRSSGTCPSAISTTSAAGTATASWPRSWRGSRLQEQRLQVAEEVEAARRGPHALGTGQAFALEQPAGLGLAQLRLDRGERQAGALGEEREREALAQAQRVEHELERQRAAGDV